MKSVKIIRKSIPVNFDLSFLKIRWSDHVLLREKGKIIGEGVVYGSNWKKAAELARQMAKLKFGRKRGQLPVCEQVFVISNKEQVTRNKKQIREIARRGSSLKVKVGRSVFGDIKTLQYIKQELKFPNKIRIDANQGYSLRQLQYLIPTLKELGIEYIEEPVSRKDLPKAVKLLHRDGIKVILDETLQSGSDWQWVIGKGLMDAVNIKLSRIGDIETATGYVKRAKKAGVNVVVGCSEELERGMEAIYALGHEAKRAGVLLEVEGFGPLRLKKGARTVPRWVNRVENLGLIVSHRVRQKLFDNWWLMMKLLIFGVKKTKLLSALSLRLVKVTGKHQQRIHPKHLLANKYPPEYLKYIDPDDVVLDVGCGNGQHSLRVAKVARRVIGFDVDRGQLSLAQKAAEAAGISRVTFKSMSAEEKLPVKSGTYSKVLCLGVLEHLVNRDLALSEMVRVLAPGGLILLGLPNEMTGWKRRQWRWGIDHFTDPDHKVEYTKEMVTRMLEERGLKVLEILPTAYDTPWAGIIDVIGGIWFGLYERLIRWKWSMAKKHPEESISFLAVAEK